MASMQNRWEYFAVVVFENGKTKDVTGYLVDAEDRLEAHKKIRSIVLGRFDDVAQIIIEDLERV